MIRAWLVVAVLGRFGVARADEPAPPAPPAPSSPTPNTADETTPWAKGVPEPTRKQAEKLFDEGNDLFGQQAHAPAIEKYQAALKLWDHPLIRFNLAVTLIRLDRALEAYDELEKALRYGDKPFKPELYRQALDYQIVLKGRVGYIEVSCDQPATSITIDGKQWFDCPGTQKKRVPAGEHTVIGQKDKYVPVTRRLVVAGDKTSAEKIKLEPFETQYKLVYPHKRWLPWTILSAGGAVALSGVGVWLTGRNQMDSFQSNFERDCALGCEKDLSQHLALRDQRDGATLKGAIGVTMMVTGGVATVAGFVFVLINTPTRVLPNLEINPTSGGMRAQVGWRF